MNKRSLNESDVQKIVEFFEPSQIKKNLDNSSNKTDADTQPKSLNEDEETPFISNELRTDK